MKRKLSFLLALMMIVMRTSAQWAFSGMVEGGSIDCIASSNTSVFVMCNDGLYFSKDNGGSWEKIQIEQIISAIVDPLKEIQQIEAYGNNVFLCTKKGVFLSTDDGSTWMDMNEGIPKGRVLERIKPFNETVVGCSSSEVFLYKKDSSKWVNIKGNIYKNIFIKDILPIQNTIYLAVYGKGVIRTNDFGKTWETISDSLPTDKVLTITLSGNNLVAGMNREGIAYKSLSENRWWVCKNLPKRMTVYNFYTTGNSIFAATSLGVYVSTDNGKTWQESSSGIGEHIQVTDVTISQGNVLIATEGAGVMKSTNFGATWELSNSGLKLPVAITALLETEGKMYCGTNGSGVFESEDGGTKWKSLNSGLPAKSIVADLALLDTVLFVGTNKGIFKLNPKTNTWVNAGGVMISQKYVNQIQVRGKTIYVATNTGLFRSYNRGKVWKSIHEKGITSSNILTFDIYIDKTDTFFYCGTEEGLFFSNDNAQSWKKIEDPKLAKITSLKIIEDELYICTEKYFSLVIANLKLTKFNNVTTGREKKGIPGKMQIRSYILSGKKNVVVAGNTGVYTTRNSGDEWTDLNLMLPNLDIYSMIGNDRVIFVGNSGGEIYYRPAFKK